MSPETQAAIFFAVGMLGFMGLGMPMALALVLTGAGMAWLLDFWAITALHRPAQLATS